MFIKILKLDDFIDCKIVRRINRFTVEVKIKGGLSFVHNTNTGRLRELIVEGKRGLLVPINGVKLRYRLVGVWLGDYYALIDTRLQAVAFEKLVGNNVVPWLRGYKIGSRNPRVGDSILDYSLVNEAGDEVLVELKSAVLRGEGAAAMYPDCPTVRGRRHIEEIIKLRREGFRALIIFIAGLKDVRCFKPYLEGDVVVGRLLSELYRVDPSSIRCLSIYLDRDGCINLDNIDVPLCGDWLRNLV